MTPTRTAPPAARKLAERPAAPLVAVLVGDEERLLAEDDLETAAGEAGGDARRGGYRGDREDGGQRLCASRGERREGTS